VYLKVEPSLAWEIVSVY